MEAALRKMDAMLASTVIAITNTLPGSANEGDLYLVGTLPTGVAAGWANRIARWRGSPAGWEAYQPMQGWIITIVGESTNKVRRYNGTAWVALAADAGAEPYAGIPAQTSFWRSTAAGVRAWVQLVAADITDLATTLAAYLTKANPTFTGRLTGPTQYLEADEQILLAIRRPAVGPQGGRIHGIAYHAQTLDRTWREFGRVMTYIGNNTDAAWTGGMRLMAYKDGAILQALEAGPDGVRVGSGLPLQMGTTTIVDSSRNITGATFKATNLVGAGDRPIAADLTGTIQPKTPDQFRNMISALSAALKGAANGVAELGADGRVPSAQLPSYVDDVLEYATFSAFPATGETGKIYINLDQNKTWRWSGSAYVEISASLALGETSATAYRGDRGKIAYDHSQASGNPHGTAAADVGALAATNPVFTGTLTQGGTTRINAVGGAAFSSVAVTGNVEAFEFSAVNGAVFGTLADSGDVFVAATNDGVIYSRTPSQARTLMGVAKAPSKQDVSASTTIGSIDATAVKVTTTDVILTLSGGVDGQGWDIINPTTATGIAIPSGATLWKSIGSDVGPTTIALGGGRPIRITRIDANTWTMLGSQ